MRSHVLLGIGIGLLGPIVGFVGRRVAGVPLEMEADDLILSGSSPRVWLTILVEMPSGIVIVALGFLAALSFLRFVARSRTAGVALCWLLLCGVYSLQADHWLSLIGGVLTVTLILWVLLNLGFLAFFAMAFSSVIFDALPIARSADDWYVGGSMFALVSVVALAMGAGLPLTVGRILTGGS